MKKGEGWGRERDREIMEKKTEVEKLIDLTHFKKDVRKGTYGKVRKYKLT